MVTFLVTVFILTATAQARFLPPIGSWCDPSNWDPTNLPGSGDFVILQDQTAIVDCAAPDTGVLNLGYNDALVGTTRLNFVDGGSLTTLNNGGWDIIGGMNTGATELNMTGNSLYHCQGWAVWNHHSTDLVTVNIGPDAIIDVDQQIYFYNGDSHTNLEGILRVDGGFVFGTGNHEILIDGGLLQVRQSVYSEQDAQNDISSGFIMGYDLVVSTVDIDGTNYTQVTGIFSGNLASNPRPEDNEYYVNPDVVLDWDPPEGLVNPDYDVYLGTDLNTVTNATKDSILPGDVDGNGEVNLSDVAIVFNQWLQDPNGLEPSADLYVDDFVDMMDYTIVAGDWKEKGIFQGTQQTASYDPEGDLAYGTDYYWRIDVDDTSNPDPGNKGLIWKFKTADSVADDDWTNLFVRTSGWHTTSGWFGADSSYSVPFERYDAPGRAGQTKTLWIFADSLTGSETGDVPQHIPYNTLAVMEGDDPTTATMDYIYGTNGNGTVAGGNAGTVFIADTPLSPPYNGSWPRLWLSDGIRLGDNMYIFSRLIAGGGEFGYTRIGTVLITVPIVDGELDLENHTKIDSHLFLPANEDRHAVMYGACILDNTVEAGAPHPDGYIYVYGAAWHPSSGDFKQYASRVTEADFLTPSAYRYWDGIGWSVEINDSVAMADGVETENAVVPMYDGRYMLVNEQRTNIYYTIADNPWGPFDKEQRQDIYLIPGIDFFGDPQIHAYNGKAHPHLSRPGELLIGHNFNIFPAHPHIFANNVYRPRFLNLVSTDIRDPDDRDAPSPDPFTWLTMPVATGENSISMAATTATDTNPVEYYFESVAGGGNDSGWQDSNTYEDTGLIPGTIYNYRAKCRDKASARNETRWSSTESAETETPLPEAPDVSNLSAENITAFSATLRGLVTAGFPYPEITIYWGETDGLMNPLNWDESITVDITDGVFSAVVSPLSDSTTYYYRCYATNSEGDDWADGTENFLTASYDSYLDREFDGSESGKWNNPLNWTPQGISETPAWVNVFGKTVEIDYTVPTVGVVNLGYNNDLINPTTLNISDGGSLTTTNGSGGTSGWDMIGGMDTGDTYLNMTGNSIYHCQGYVVFNHHSTGTSYMNIGPNAQVNVDQQIYYWNGNSETFLEGTITVENGLVWGTGIHVTTISGNGKFRVVQSVYSIAQANSDITAGRFVRDGGSSLSVTTVNVSGTVYTQIALP